MVRCYLNESSLQAVKFNFEKEEEDLVRSHWENFQHPKPTILYKQLANNMREEIRSNFIRTQTVKYEHDIVQENLPTGQKMWEIVVLDLYESQKKGN